MFKVRLFAAALLGAAMLGSLSAPAAENPDSALLEDLRTLAKKSREQRAADRWLQRELDDLVARYDWPWQRQILFDDFSDGDFSRNPAWQVLQGRFQVIRGQGLNAAVGGYDRHDDTDSTPPAQQSPEAALGGLIVGALLDRTLGSSGTSTDDGDGNARRPSVESGPNRIRLKAGVSNAFAITLSFRLEQGLPSRFDLALLQSEQGSYGYRLRVDTGDRGFVELERIRRGRGAIVDGKSLSVNLNDGRLHDLAWRQDRDGGITVLLDEQPLIEVRDRAFRDAYPWLQLEQQAGDLTVRSLRIEGV